MRYQFNTDYTYCVNLYNIVLINPKTNNTVVLEYPEAAVLDLLFKKYQVNTIIRLLSKIGVYTESHAAGIFDDTFKLLQHHKVIIQQ